MEHHVYFWLKEDYQNPAARAEFEQGLQGLLDCPLVEGGRWAVPAEVAPRPVVDQSWHYALSIQFATIADHDAYQVDSGHLEFIIAFKDRWAKVLIMDLA